MPRFLLCGYSSILIEIRSSNIWGEAPYLLDNEVSSGNLILPKKVRNVSLHIYKNGLLAAHRYLANDDIIGMRLVTQ